MTLHQKLKKISMRNTMTEHDFFGFPLNKGIDPNAFHFVWLELNCYIERPHKRLSYNEFKVSLFNSFCMYSRKRYEMTPLLRKDMSLDIFMRYLNKYLQNADNYRLLVESVQSQKLSSFFDEFVSYIAVYFFT